MRTSKSLPSPTMRPDGLFNPPQSLADASNSILRSGAYSDMKIRLCDGTEIDCHRAILSERCDFFKGALRAGLKETQTCVIEMLNDPPKAIRALVHYLYTEEYLEKGFQPLDLALFHVDMYTVSDIYLVKELEDMAQDRLMDNLKTAPEVLPDILKAIKERKLEFGEHPKIYRWLMDWALYESGPVNADTWDIMRKENPSFIQDVSNKARVQWEERCAYDATKWLERFEGRNSTGRMVLAPLKCPSRCGYNIEELFVSWHGTAKAQCVGCGEYFSSATWIAHDEEERAHWADSDEDEDIESD